MSLLERINQKTQESEAASAEQVQAQEAEAQMPDATKQHSESRAGYGQFISNGERKTLNEEQASPEEQEMFTVMEKTLTELVYGEKTNRAILKTVNSAGDPVEGIAMVAHDLVRALEKKHPDMPEDILLAIGESAVEQVVDLVESAMPQVDLTETQMAEALSIATTKWMESNPGRVDGDMMQYMAQEAPDQLGPEMMGQQQGAKRSPMEAMSV